MDVALDLAITPIRAATRDRHVHLESVLQLVAPLSRARYLAALRGFELFLSEWEPRIEAALPAQLRPWFSARSRRALLQRDLAHLDTDAEVLAPARRACRLAVAEIDLRTPAGTFGSLYVLEGSALGGQVIAAEAKATLGIDRGNGAGYFNGLDDHPAKRWASFRLLLEAQVGAKPAARRHACTAACQTFDALIVIFSPKP